MKAKHRVRALPSILLFLLAISVKQSGAFAYRIIESRTPLKTIPISKVVAFYGRSEDESPDFLNAPSSERSASEPTTIFEYPDFLPSPNPALSAVDVVAACMDTLLERKDAGLEVCFRFSSDRCRAAIGGSLDKFAAYAQNPTFGYLIHCCSWEITSVGPIIPGTSHRGSMQTVLMVARAAAAGKVTTNVAKSNKGGADDSIDGRRFLWTLQQERRPPLQGCWMIHEVLYTKNSWQQTL